MTAAPAPIQSSCWADVVESVRAGESSGLEKLYHLINGTAFRCHFVRHLGSQDVDDRIHDLFLRVATHVRNGDLRDPERLMGYLWTILRNQVRSEFRTIAQGRLRDVDLVDDIRDQRANPERELIEKSQKSDALRLLKELQARDREVLVRFYLKEQSPSRIRVEMGLTPKQFDLVKYRALLRFGVLGRRRLAMQRLQRLSRRSHG